MHIVHQKGPDGRCLGCIHKLTEADSFFDTWFWSLIPESPDLHISWSFRNEADQEHAFKDGKSRLHWPDSAHNRMVNGKPCSAAVDLFEIYNGQPLWRPSLMAHIAQRWTELIWGGAFKSLGDFDHFQIKISGNP